MPKGYGYDKAPKKASGFKMKGFSYAGDSPMKGKRKQMELQAAADKKYGAMDNINSAMGEMSPMKETALSIPMRPIQLIPTETSEPQLQKVAEYNPPAAGPKKSFGESFKAAMGTELGVAAGKALVEGAINLGVGALANRNKKEPRKKVNAANAFSQINITGRS